MKTDRRRFLHTTASLGALAATGGLAVLGASCASTGRGRARRKKRILILGGTSFVGPALSEACLERGHALTLFNSGRTEDRRAEAGRPSVVPAGVETLIGNRDPLLTADDRRLAGDPEIESKRDPDSPRGLTQLEGRTWDAVIDTSGFFPRMVKSSAELLAPHVDRYLYISSISVYSDFSRPGMDETTELLTLEDPTTEEFGENFENYGGGKAMCEAAAEAAMPGRTANVRPGFIVGPRDTSRRFLYYPWRVSQGGEMLAPGAADHPLQLIDVRDLAEWLVLCVEQGTTGVFNATGPARELSMGGMLAGCRAAAGTDTACTFADPEFLGEQGLAFPLYVPPAGETAGFHRVSVEAAVASGLAFRPVEETARASLAWHASLPEDLREHVLPPVDLAKEAEVLAVYKELPA